MPTPESTKTNLQLFASFLIDLFVGAVGFSAIAVVAVGLGRVVAWAETEKLPDVIGFVLHWVEIGMFVVDVIGFLCFIGKSLYLLIRDTFK